MNIFSNLEVKRDEIKVNIELLNLLHLKWIIFSNRNPEDISNES